MNNTRTTLFRTKGLRQAPLLHTLTDVHTCAIYIGIRSVAVSYSSVRVCGTGIRSKLGHALGNFATVRPSPKHALLIAPLGQGALWMPQWGSHTVYVTHTA